MSPPVAAATSQAVENKEVGAALKEAQRLAGRKQWNAALAQLDTAKAVPGKSDYAQYKILEFEGYVLSQKKDYRNAADSFAELARMKAAPPTNVPRYLKTSAQLYMQAKAYDRAADLATQALKSSPGDEQLLEVAGQASYLAGNYPEAARNLEKLVSMNSKSREKPKESWLQLILSSYDKMHDETHAASAWDSLLQYYPKPEYWQAVLDRKLREATSESLQAGYRRLMFEVGALKDPRDYEELALSAIDAGTPSEAVRVLQTGLDNGVLKANESRYRRMLSYAEKKRAEADASVKNLTAQRKLPPDASIELGTVHLARGDYDRAIAELQRGLTSDRVSEPDKARIALGIAYLKSDRSELARKNFEAVARNSEWRDLAELWNIRASEEPRTEPVSS
jgi:tetratricopeptide (TPR) repeat protein